ncbi:Isoleucyl-tRNA synthetase [Candidatus Omnitrophus magneticus]|uniref:Isoleucine--tRNA ligase n=1 Tax=Candidatus Omnitrophus magneticus TaxID=1609969 RepID=A0A0F0CUI7_9BACT|nr:Isoleucyl-tRNA synthetase [Candidatus Omnitrophus magneticus]
MNKENTGINYKDTLNLPRTDFPMKAGLQQKEPELLKKWEQENTYSAILEKRKVSGKKFILHDGPPYANGHIHMGHVLNKILKDICVKYYSMKGYTADFVPGWDCHGLPVEHQLLKELKIHKSGISQVEFRKKAYNYAMKFVKIQMDEFKRLGIFASWDKPYLTLTKEYEADIIFALAELFDKGFIYKGLKPVNWCKTCETALAEAEVEYEDKKSPSIYVKFPALIKKDGRDVYFIIWTTTPWTLLANTAIALHPDLSYAFVKMDNEVWIMAKDLVHTNMEKFGIKNFEIISEQKGIELASSIKSAAHPFIDRASIIVLAEYVSKEEGTGCVHTAPGHGQDDYNTGKKYKLPILMPVDDKGKFNAEGGEFAGQDVIESNKGIIEKLKRDDRLILASEISHSYPHCWRCKEPVIFRATEQWFVNIEHNDLRSRILTAIDKDVEWIPSIGKERISSMVKNRPDWCLSRQRYWGVPIPAVQCLDCGKSYTSTELIKKAATLTREKGDSAWFLEPIETFFSEGFKCPNCGADAKKFKKEENILDVWFDSGISHRAVLETRENLASPADLYLEGSDQHRGWFQSSLITSMALNNRPPYRKVLTHGFVVDGEGKKMSKSLGNVISPNDVMKEYGADILRLWVSSSNYEGDIKLSPEILARLADGYKKIRNTFKYLLSNLYDFDPEKNYIKLEELSEIDRWMLSKLYSLLKEVTNYYDMWEFHKVYRGVYNFCVYEISAFYLDIVKDVLYILSPDSKERRSCQTVLYEILQGLVRVIAPVLSFTTEEVWKYMPGKLSLISVHMADWPRIEKIGAWENKTLDDKWENILKLRETVTKLLETKRETGAIGSSLDAMLYFYPLTPNAKFFVESNLNALPLVFRVSQVKLIEWDLEGMDEVSFCELKIKVEKAFGEKCPRCWNYSETFKSEGEHKNLCGRCFGIIQKRGSNA